MTYAVSDIHGCYDKYLQLLEAINFGPEDMLFVLGDVIDRGPDGFRILLDMAERFNVVGLLGNHEAMAVDALPGILRSVRQGDGILTRKEADAADLWLCNGGELSLAGFFGLDTDRAQAVWDYLRKMLLYREVKVGNRQFVLVHGGLEGFSPTRPLEDYDPDEILWFRPEEDTVYYQDKYVVFGHTPVQILDIGNANPDVPAKIYREGKLIDIDCGCTFPRGQLGCLCLDTMKEVYV